MKYKTEREPFSRTNLNKKFFLSCIIPVYNEQTGIAKFISELEHYVKSLTNFYELILIDDGSNDGTSNIIESFTANQKIKLIQLSRNFGKEIAISVGLEHCQGDIAIILDSDFQHPFNLLPVFLQHWHNGYDMVFGIRENRDNETKLKRTLTKGFYKLINLLTKEKIIPNAGDFRLLDRKVIDALNACEERTRFMKGLYAWVGFTNIGVPFKVPQRQLGKSAWHFNNLAELAITGITSFSNVPLRVWSFIGLMISCSSFLFAVYMICKTLMYGVDLPGYPSLMVAIMFFGGIQLLSIGILGEYIARIFNEVKHRPKYIIRKKIGLK
jgi:glycosyltransferase involved in cell wall biosynthesis